MPTVLNPLVILNRKPKHNIPLHGEFLQSAYLAGVPARYYGPRQSGIVMGNLPFDRKSNFGLLVKELNANAVIIYRAGFRDMEWLDVKALRKLDVPIILIDVDFCFIDPRTDMSVAMDMHFLRHPSDVKRSKNKKKDELPFSFNPRVYAYGLPDNREGVCYTGSLRKVPFYSARIEARAKLKANVPSGQSRMISSRKQAQFYRKHKAAITDAAGQYNYLNGKHFEITACGTVLFTVGGNGVDRHLPKDTYVTYKADCSDIVGLWTDVEKNWSVWAKKAKEAADYVAQHHTHAQRWFDLIDKTNAALGTDFTMSPKVKEKVENDAIVDRALADIQTFIDTVKISKIRKMKSKGRRGLRKMNKRPTVKATPQAPNIEQGETVEIRRKRQPKPRIIKTNKAQQRRIREREKRAARRRGA